MIEKIEWYREVLEQEPSSRVFFPLAKLLLENGRPEEAIPVLHAGLQQHPDFLEARLFLIQLLYGQGRSEECVSEVAKVTQLFEAYPLFWDAWAHSASGTNRHLERATRLMAASFRFPAVSLEQLLDYGLQALFQTSAPDRPVRMSAEEAGSVTAIPRAGRYADEMHRCPAPSRVEAERGTGLRAASAVKTGDSSGTAMPLSESLSTPVTQEEPSVSEPVVEEADESEEPTLRTRSMAEVLAEQGDFAGALEIYQELEAAAPTPEEAAVLHQRVVSLITQLGGTIAVGHVEKQPNDGLFSQEEPSPEKVSVDVVPAVETDEQSLSPAEEVSAPLEEAVAISQAEEPLLVESVSDVDASVSELCTDDAETVIKEDDAEGADRLGEALPEEGASGNKLKNLLESLADRLEARART